MTRTASHNDQTPPKIENPWKQNTKEINTTHCDHHNQSEGSQSFGKSMNPPTVQRVKSGNNKEARKPVVPAVTIYATNKEGQLATNRTSR